MRRSRLLSASSRASYLARLKIDDPGEPSVPALRALHRAHVERVPYEALEIQLGRPTTVDPLESVGWVLRGRGGYCVQLNGAFAVLLSALGYDVTWHRSGVQANASIPSRGAHFAPHPVLTVEVEGMTWLVDVGLGDGLIEPLPLRTGTYRQGPFTFRLGSSRIEAGGWRLAHDPRGSIAGLDIAMSPAVPADFAKWHPYVMHSPESRVVRLAVVMRRDQAGADRLRGCMLGRIDRAGKTERELTRPDDWFGALAEVFGLPMAHFNAEERAALWAKVRASHERWRAAEA